MRLDVALDELLPHPIDAVWAALTDAEAISDWLMRTENFRPQVGTRFRLKTRDLSPDGWVEAQVLELDPPRRMVWAWSVDQTAPTTTVTFELTPQGDETRLTLTHVGNIDASIVERLSNGWPGRIRELALVAGRNKEEHD
jgi:uncharacterized protein YndB with AHSA1/START domain